MELADLTAKNVPPIEKQTNFSEPIWQYGVVKKETALAHLQISHLRDIAKKEGCMMPDELVDPDYHGKNNL
jgi:hypothetical protein